LGMALAGVMVALGRTDAATKKKHKKHKKPKATPAPITPAPPPPSCTPSCGGACGAADGCGGVCQTGSCGTGTTCVGGQCVPTSGSCPSPCVGGRTCQNGTCACPSGKPFGACAGAGDFCRECCLPNDCGSHSEFSGYECRHDLGGICQCRPGTHDCGTGVCWPCCTTDHCAEIQHSSIDGFICTADTHDCVCLAESDTACPKNDGSLPTRWECVNLNSDQRCGTSCNSSPPCETGGHCVNHQCHYGA
jgi:hypothetical protein